MPRISYAILNLDDFMSWVGIVFWNNEESFQLHNKNMIYSARLESIITSRSEKVLLQFVHLKLDLVNRNYL